MMLDKNEELNKKIILNENNKMKIDSSSSPDNNKIKNVNNISLSV